MNRTITSFQNPKMRDSSQPAVHTVTKSGKVLVSDESVTPPKQLSKDILKAMIKSDTKVTINIDQVYASRNAKYTHFTDDNGDLCVIANYSAPYQGIAVSIPC